MTVRYVTAVHCEKESVTKCQCKSPGRRFGHPGLFFVGDRQTRAQTKVRNGLRITTIILFAVLRRIV